MGRHFFMYYLFLLPRHQINQKPMFVTFTFLGNCITCGGGYSDDYQVKTVNSISTHDLCQAECQKASNCTVFSFKDSSSRCYLSYATGSVSSDSDYSYGPKYCPGLSNTICKNVKRWDSPYHTAYQVTM